MAKGMSCATCNLKDETQSQLLNVETQIVQSPPPWSGSGKPDPRSYPIIPERRIGNSCPKLTDETRTSTQSSPSCHDKFVGIVCKRRGPRFSAILAIILLGWSIGIFVFMIKTRQKHAAEMLLPMWTETSLIPELLTTTELPFTPSLPLKPIRLAHEPPSSKHDCPKVFYSESMQFHDIHQCNPSSIRNVSIESTPNFQLADLPHLAPQILELKIKLGEHFCPEYPDSEIRLPTLQNLTIIGSEVCADNSPVFMIRAPNLLQLRLSYLRVTRPFRKEILEFLQEPCNKERGTLKYFYVGHSHFYIGGQLKAAACPRALNPRENIQNLV